MVSRPLLASSDEDDEHAATLVEVAKLGSLKIGAQLGTGAFAHVFAATHASLGRVAVKVLLDTHRGSTVARRCFTREALIMSQISHRSIVKAYGLHRIPASSPGLPPANGIAERWMMLLECCDGGSLARLLVKQMKDSWQPAYSQGQALQWLADVAEGLAHLHQQKRPLVHRDIKLENIMLHNSKELKRKVRLSYATNWCNHPVQPP
ncbi:kinase-like domain-containing protein [Haematococcus lacustris]